MDYYVCGLVIGITKGTESLKRFRPEFCGNIIGIWSVFNTSTVSKKLYEIITSIHEI